LHYPEELARFLKPLRLQRGFRIWRGFRISDSPEDSRKDSEFLISLKILDRVSEFLIALEISERFQNF